jgi:hypothetical protein
VDVFWERDREGSMTLPSDPDPGQLELDAMVDAFNDVQRECRELRLKVLALVDRYHAYSDRIAAAEAQEKSA